MWKFGSWLSINHSKFSSTISAQELRFFFGCPFLLWPSLRYHALLLSQYLTSWEVWKWNDSDPPCQKAGNATKFRVAEAIDTVPTQNISIAWSIPLSLWLAMTCSAATDLFANVHWLFARRRGLAQSEAFLHCSARHRPCSQQEALYGNENAFKILHFCAFR